LVSKLTPSYFIRQALTFTKKRRMKNKSEASKFVEAAAAASVAFTVRGLGAAAAHAVTAAAAQGLSSFMSFLYGYQAFGFLVD
jgi:hypothetical protein